MSKRQTNKTGRHRFHVLCVSASAICFAAACGRGPEFAVTNRSIGNVDDVRLEHSGGTEVIGSLTPGETKSIRINPRGESHLKIDFRDAQGSVREQVIDVYFERGYRGKLSLYIEQDLRVTWTGRLEP
jgi:hypothetical protein